MLKHCPQSSVDVQRRSLRRSTFDLDVYSSSLSITGVGEQSDVDDGLDKFGPLSAGYCQVDRRRVCTLPRQCGSQSLTQVRQAQSRPDLHGLVDTVIIKVYAECLRPDLEYKTMTAGPSTTSKQIILTLLGKFKMKHRDPKLFYLTMEVTITLSGSPVTRVLKLDDESHPANLVSCTPWANLKFRLKSRKGGLVRIYDSILMKESQYKCLLISETTTAEDVVKILLNCYSLTTDPNSYTLFHEGSATNNVRLEPSDRPLRVVSSWKEASGDRLVLALSPEPTARQKDIGEQEVSRLVDAKTVKECPTPAALGPVSNDTVSEVSSSSGHESYCRESSSDTASCSSVASCLSVDSGHCGAPSDFGVDASKRKAGRRQAVTSRTAVSEEEAGSFKLTLRIGPGASSAGDVNAAVGPTVLRLKCPATQVSETPCPGGTSPLSWDSSLHSDGDEEEGDDVGCDLLSSERARGSFFFI